MHLIQTKLWIRYVNNTCVIVKTTQIDRTHDVINTVFRDIKFTIDCELDETLSFWEKLVSEESDGVIETSMHHRKTHTNKILSYHGNHPDKHKRSCIRTLFKGIQTHCNSAAEKRKEEKHLFQPFQRNGLRQKYAKRCILKNRQNKD